MINYIRYLTTLIYLHLLSVHFWFISVLVLQQQGKSVFSSVQISSVYNISSINDIIFLKCTFPSFLVLLCTCSLMYSCMAKFSFGNTAFYNSPAFVTTRLSAFESGHSAEISGMLPLIYFTVSREYPLLCVTDHNKADPTFLTRAANFAISQQVAPRPSAVTEGVNTIKHSASCCPRSPWTISIALAVLIRARAVSTETYPLQWELIEIHQRHCHVTWTT